MEIKQLAAIPIIGIAVRTTNQEGQSAIDIPQLWATFHSQQLQHKIPNACTDTIYVIYTHYERDHTTPYTAIIGCQVSSLDDVPEGMVTHSIAEGSYIQRIVRGNLVDNIVFNEWIDIWNSPNLNRSYTSDFEVYSTSSQHPTQAEVAIYIATQ